LKRFVDYALLFSIAGIVILLDQWTKWLVRANLAIQETWVPWDWLVPYARIVHWKNTGVVFGLFQNIGDVILVLSALVSIVIIYYFPKVPKQEIYLRIALSLQLGGAVGNLIDRISRGYVTDFISVGKFAVFNVADSSISIGVVVLLVGAWITERRQKGQRQNSETAATPEDVKKLPESHE
jgi:signal peptidase II